MDTPTFADQVAGVAALAEPVRRQLFLHVVAQPEPVTRDAAAEALGLPRHTVKFHLDRLVEDGLLDIDFKRLTGREGPGAGRPTKRYRRSARELRVSIPERRYDIAGEIMATAIEDSMRGNVGIAVALERAAAATGTAIGTALHEQLAPRASRALRLSALRSAVDVLGYESRQTDGGFEMANCPFHALAKEHTDLVCGMNRTFLGAMVECLGDDRLTAVLEPSEARCCVVVRA